MATTKRTPEEIEELKTAVLNLDGECKGSNKRIAERLNERGLKSLSDDSWTGGRIGSFKQRYLAIPKPVVSNTSITELDQETTEQPPDPSELATTCDSSIREQGSDMEKEADAMSVTDLSDTSSEVAGNIEAEQPATIYDRPAIEQEPLGTVLETCNIPTTDASAPTLPDDLVALLATAHENGDIEALLTWWRSEKGGVMDKQQRPRFIGERVNSGLLVNRALKDRAIARAKQENMSLSQLVELLFWRYVGEPNDVVGE